MYAIQLFFLCFLGTVAPIVSQGTCKSLAPCVVLPQCPGFIAMIKLPPSDMIKKFLRYMHCGFTSTFKPLICCPPEFSVDYLNMKADSVASLLPDLNICGTSDGDRIYGGVMTELDEHPWMALIRYDSPKRKFHCGGVLISSRYILTAAHCVQPRRGSLSSTVLLEVRLGEWNTSSTTDCSSMECSPPPVDVPVEEIIAHKEYNPSGRDQRHDIALLRLSQEVTFTDFIKPICLPTSEALRRYTFEGYDMEVAGWGQTEFYTQSEIKQKVTLPVVKNNFCQVIYNDLNRTIFDTQICAGGSPGQDSCRGDSGGPLMAQVSVMQNWMAIGVVSYGPSPCGTPGWPGVYTRVTAYVDWILANLRP